MKIFISLIICGIIYFIVSYFIKRKKKKERFLKDLEFLNTKIATIERYLENCTDLMNSFDETKDKANGYISKISLLLAFIYFLLYNIGTINFFQRIKCGIDDINIKSDISSYSYSNMLDEKTLAQYEEKMKNINEKIAKVELEFDAFSKKYKTTAIAE